MKATVWIIGGAALVSGGVWFWFWYNSPEQRRLRSLGAAGLNSVVKARTQEAPAGTPATIFHEPTLENVGVDMVNLGVVPPL